MAKVNSLVVAVAGNWTVIADVVIEATYKPTPLASFGVSIAFGNDEVMLVVKLTVTTCVLNVGTPAQFVGVPL